ncbi:MAG: hypothetical protein L3J76_03990, partial [Candidatus Hydrothermae bacterium]|nr:hypothetical protein [Candidatus Hydrothermae bacterium]
MMLWWTLLAVIQPTLNYDLGPCFRVISLDGFRAEVLVNVEVRKGSEPPRFVYTYGVINDPQSSQGIFSIDFFPPVFPPDSILLADTLIWPEVWTTSINVPHGPHPVETLGVWFPVLGMRRVAVRRAPVVLQRWVVPPVFRRRPDDSIQVWEMGELEYGSPVVREKIHRIAPGDTLLGMGAVSRLFPAVGTVYMESDVVSPTTCEDTGPPMDSLPYVPPNWAAIVDSFYHLTPYGAGRVQPGVGPGYVFPTNGMQAFADLQVELERVDSAGWIPDTTVRAYVARALASAEDRVRRGDRVGARAVLEQLMQDLAGYQKGG